MFRRHRLCLRRLLVSRTCRLHPGWRPTSSRPRRHRVRRHRRSLPELRMRSLRVYHPASCTFSRLHRRRRRQACNTHRRRLARSRQASCRCRRHHPHHHPPCIKATCVRSSAAPRPRTTRRRRPRTAACFPTTRATRPRAWPGSSPPRCAPRHLRRSEVKLTGRAPTLVVLRIHFSEHSVR